MRPFHGRASGKYGPEWSRTGPQASCPRKPPDSRSIACSLHYCAATTRAVYPGDLIAPTSPLYKREFEVIFLSSKAQMCKPLFDHSKYISASPSAIFILNLRSFRERDWLLPSLDDFPTNQPHDVVRGLRQYGGEHEQSKHYGQPKMCFIFSEYIPINLILYNAHQN